MENLTIQPRSLLLLLCLFIFSACGGGDGNGTGSDGDTGNDGTGNNGSTSDTTAPLVSDKSPSAFSRNITRDSVLTATFNEDMFTTTIDADSFTLAGATSVSGSVGFDAVTNIASFTPDNNLAPLTSYTATLDTSITDLAGNALASNYDWSFTTADGSWGTPELLENENAGSALHPQVAFDNNGNALAVWQHSDGMLSHIVANRYEPDTGWGTAELIETNTAGRAKKPEIAFDNNGNAIAIWHQFDGIRDSIYANRYVSGTGWGTVELVETSSTGSASLPQISFDANGNAIAVWQQGDGTRDNIRFNRYVPGTGWGTAALIESNNTGDASTVQIAIDNNGNAIAVWNHIEGSRDTNSIWANRYVVDSGWETPVLIESNNSEGGEFPQVAFDGNGDAIAVWQQDANYTSIWAIRYANGTGWGTATLIETSDIGHATLPQIAFDDSDNAVAIWQQHDGANTKILVNRYIPGAGWRTPEVISRSSSGDAAIPHIAFDTSGNALAVWEHKSGSFLSVWSNRYVSGDGWGSAEELESYSSGNAYLAQVAIDSSGKALAVWEQTSASGTRDDIWASRFE